MKLIKLTAVLAMLAITGSAQAALFDRGGGLIYDDTLNITWLSDANYAATSGYDTRERYPGSMSWDGANTWASNLVFGGYDDWRLPVTGLASPVTGACSGGCVANEMDYMFYNNMGASYGNGILSGANTANLALFTNLKEHTYWSSTPSAWERGAAWAFRNSGGYSHVAWQQHDYFHAWAVRDGDITAAVPEPETYAMLLAGLGLMGGIARRRKQKLNA